MQHSHLFLTGPPSLHFSHLIYIKRSNSLLVHWSSISNKGNGTYILKFNSRFVRVYRFWCLLQFQSTDWTNLKQYSLTGHLCSNQPDILKPWLQQIPLLAFFRLSLGNMPSREDAPGENSNPLQYSCLENPMDRPWGHKESDTTERLTLSLSVTWLPLGSLPREL